MITSADQKFGPEDGKALMHLYRSAETENYRIFREYQERINAQLDKEYSEGIDKNPEDFVPYSFYERLRQRLERRERANERLFEIRNKKAWDLVKTGDPDFDWIIDNSHRFPYELGLLIQRCPMDWNKLWNLAQWQSWCPQFSVRVVRAVRDGIIARDVVTDGQLLWFVNNITGGIYYERYGTRKSEYDDLFQLFGNSWNQYEELPF